MEEEVRCPSCGSLSPSSYRFCGTCGSMLPLPVLESVDYKYIIESPAKKGIGIVEIIRKIFGGLLIGIGILFSLILRFGVFLALCVYVGFTFVDKLNDGLWSAVLNAGLSLIIGGFVSWILYMVFGLIGLGILGAGSALWESGEEAQERKRENEYDRQYIEKENKKQSNAFGTWGLVLGIIGIFWWQAVCGIIAVVLGILQFRRHISKRSIAGFTLGIVDIVLAVVFYVLGITSFIF